MSFTAASGYSSLQANTTLTTPYFYKQILERNWLKDFIPDVTWTVADQNLITGCHSEYRFMLPVEVSPWRNYELNQEFIPDQFTVRQVSVRACHYQYKQYKFDTLDIMRLCEKWDTLEESLLYNLYRVLTNSWRSYIVAQMILQAYKGNKGITAGLNGNINLGGLGAPVVVSPDQNAASYVLAKVANLREVLTQRGRWYPGEMVLIVPIGFSTILSQTIFAKQFCCDVDKMVAVNGLLTEDFYGFKVYQQEVLPAVADAAGINGIANYIIAAWNKAFVFQGEIIRGDLSEDFPRNAGLYYTMLAGYGGTLVYNEAVAIGYWTW